MDEHQWVREFAGAVTVCDPDGIILEMNDRSAKMFREQGGRELVGSNLLDCHPEPARAKLMQLMEEKRANVYTTEKNGIKKLIYQSPWYKDERYGGFVEIVLEIPSEMPHFIRGGS
jgi:transcriptional regulator with PAS, ATPase and Fis domain